MMAQQAGKFQPGGGPAAGQQQGAAPPGPAGPPSAPAPPAAPVARPLAANYPVPQVSTPQPQQQQQVCTSISIIVCSACARLYGKPRNK